jgi:hypothetical protein
MIPTVNKGLKPGPGNCELIERKELIYLTSQRNDPRAYIPLPYIDFFKMLTFSSSKNDR